MLIIQVLVVDTHLFGCVIEHGYSKFVSNIAMGYNRQNVAYDNVNAGLRTDATVGIDHCVFVRGRTQN